MHSYNREDYFSASSVLQKYYWAYRPTQCRGKGRDEDEYAEDPEDEPADSDDEDDECAQDPPSNTGGGAGSSDEYAELGGDDDTSTW